MCCYSEELLKHLFYTNNYVLHVVRSVPGHGRIIQSPEVLTNKLCTSLITISYLKNSFIKYYYYGYCLNNIK